MDFLFGTCVIGTSGDFARSSQNFASYCTVEDIIGQLLHFWNRGNNICRTLHEYGREGNVDWMDYRNIHFFGVYVEIPAANRLEKVIRYCKG